MRFVCPRKTVELLDRFSILDWTSCAEYYLYLLLACRHRGGRLMVLVSICRHRP